MHKIKLMNLSDIDGFFKVIDSCAGNVYLIGDDINLNLKSKLAQYFSLAKLFSDGNIPELELYITDSNDMDKLVNFMMMGVAS